MVEVEGEDGQMSAAQLRALVEYLGLSRQEAARALKVNESSVYRWWMGLSTVSGETVQHLQKALGFSKGIEEQVLQELGARGRARVPYDQEDLEELVAGDAEYVEYGPVFYRVAAARALLTYDESAVKPGRLVWLDPSRVEPKRRRGGPSRG